MRDAEGIFYELPMVQVIRIIYKALGFHTPIYHSAIQECQSYAKSVVSAIASKQNSKVANEAKWREL